MLFDAKSNLFLLLLKYAFVCILLSNVKWLKKNNRYILWLHVFILPLVYYTYANKAHALRNDYKHKSAFKMEAPYLLGLCCGLPAQMCPQKPKRMAGINS